MSAKKAAARTKTPREPSSANDAAISALPVDPDVQDEALPPEPDIQKAYDSVVPKLANASTGHVVPCNVDPLLALHNLRIGLASIRAVGGRIKNELPATSLARLAEQEEFALALVFAARQVNRTRKSTGARALVRATSQLRHVMFPAAESLAASGLLPAEASHEVERIRAGTGYPDLAQDVIDLASFFRKHASRIRGKTFIDEAYCAKAAETGNALLAALIPGGAKKGKTSDLPGAKEALVRDRIWTELLRRYDEMWRTGAYLFGRDAVDHEVPSLLAHANRPRPKRRVAAAG